MGSVPVAGDITFGPWLKARRKTLDLTQRDLAQRVGCTAITIRKFEAGERRPSKQVAERLAVCLEIPPDEQAAFVQFARTTPIRDEIAPVMEPPTPQPAATVILTDSPALILPLAEMPTMTLPGAARGIPPDPVAVPMAITVSGATAPAAATMVAAGKAGLGSALAGAPPALLAPAAHYRPPARPRGSRTLLISVLLVLFGVTLLLAARSLPPPAVPPAGGDPPPRIVVIAVTASPVDTMTPSPTSPAAPTLPAASPPPPAASTRPRASTWMPSARRRRSASG